MWQVWFQNIARVCCPPLSRKPTGRRHCTKLESFELGWGSGCVSQYSQCSKAKHLAFLAIVLVVAMVVIVVPVLVAVVVVSKVINYWHYYPLIIVIVVVVIAVVVVVVVAGAAAAVVVVVAMVVICCGCGCCCFWSLAVTKLSSLFLFLLIAFLNHPKPSLLAQGESNPLLSGNARDTSCRWQHSLPDPLHKLAAKAEETPAAACSFCSERSLITYLRSIPTISTALMPAWKIMSGCVQSLKDLMVDRTIGT